MKHIILGYGYSGLYLAKALLKKSENVTAIARNPQNHPHLNGLKVLASDVSQKIDVNMENAILYYFIPPQNQGKKDRILYQFLNQLTHIPATIIYFGSSGVYGDHKGKWVNETSKCIIHYERQQRRLDAEKQLLHFYNKHQCNLICLRTAAIYGPNRLPVTAVKEQKPLIHPDEAPVSNYIYVRDLVNIAIQLSTLEHDNPIYNISDGEPKPMGHLQAQLAATLETASAPYISFANALEDASPIKKEFMTASKRLSIEKLQSKLGNKLKLTPMNRAIEESIVKKGC